MGAPVAIGNILGDDVVVYRAFALDGNRRKGKIRARAFYRPSDHTDGLSVGLTPEAAVSHLDTNHGYCKLLVGNVHALPYHLEVRLDPQDDGHALIHNLPCIDSENDDERKNAEMICGVLAKCAELVTDKPYYPIAEGPEKPNLP